MDTVIRELFEDVMMEPTTAAFVGAIVARTHGRNYVAIWREGQHVWLMDMDDPNATPSVHAIPSAIMALWAAGQDDADTGKMLIGHLVDDAPMLGYVNAYGVAVLHE